MPNYDEKTGIAYGVISPNALNQDVLNDISQEGTDPNYEETKKSLIQDISTLCDNYGINIDNIDIDNFIQEMADHYESSCDGTFDYSDKEYTLHNSADNFGLYVIRSPYYTYCQKCSPCAPGAGDLNSPVDMDGAGGRSEPSPYQLFSNQCGDKSYCLDSSFFDDGKAPYRVFRVEDDQEVI